MNEMFCLSGVVLASTEFVFLSGTLYFVVRIPRGTDRERDNNAFTAALLGTLSLFVLIVWAAVAFALAPRLLGF